MAQVPEEPQYDLVMPFVPVKSRGGPHDDDAYVAGYEMGQLNAVLASAPPAHEATIRSDNAAQADLIAMRHDYRCTVKDSDVDEWVFAAFTPISGDLAPGSWDINVDGAGDG